MNLRHFFFFVLFCAFLTQINDLKAQQKFHFSPRISNLQIRDICQDSLGYLWIATARGVNRYNGYEYAQVFRDEVIPENSIPSSRINKLHLGRSNNLWIATHRGLSKYDIKHDKTTSYNINNKQNEYYVTDIQEDSTGNLWITTYNDGLLRLDPSTEELSEVTPSYKLPKPSRTQALFIDEQQNIWIGYSNRSALGRYNIHDKSTDLYTLPDYIEINCITKFTASQIWLGTDQGVLAYNIKTRKFVPIPQSLQKQTELTSAKINSIKLTNNENYIITSTNHGYKYCIQTGVTTRLSQKKEKNSQNNDITCALEDRQGNLWLGTFEKGLIKINTEESAFNTPGLALTPLEGKAATVSCEDKFGRVWFGSKYDGLYLRAPNGTVSHFSTANHPALTAIAHNGIRALHCDTEGRIWIGIGRSLIIGEVTPAGFTQITALNNFGHVTAISEDRHGNLWVGSFAGLYFFGKTPTTQPTQITKKGPIFSIVPYKEDQIVFAEYGQDLFVIDTDHPTSQPKLFVENMQLSNKEKINTCTDLCITSDGMLWIGCYNKILLRYNPKTNSITPYLQPQGIASNDILALTEDAYGYLWLATSNGLSRLDPKSGIFRNFNESDGLTNTQFAERGMLCASDGRIYISGNCGVDCLDPGNIKENSYHPVGILEELKIQDHHNKKEDNSSILTTALAYATNITLKHWQNSFSIDYAAIDYNYTDKLRYTYQLEGFDKDWIDAGSNKKATYANLPSGSYRFNLRVQNGDGVWSPASGVDITVKPSPWLSWWAYLLYILTGSSGIMLIFRLYFRTKFNKKALQLSEQQRQHEQEINQQKIDFYGNISHELRTPLTLINGNIELLTQRAAIGGDENKLISMLSYNSNRLLRLVNQLLDLSRMENNTMPLHITQTDIIPIIRNVSNAFRFNAQNREAEYEIELEQESLKIYTDEDVLEKILTNLISNAIKYTPRKGRITLRIVPLNVTEATQHYTHLELIESNYLEFRITNSCQKLDPSQLNAIFERFTRLDNIQQEATPGSGIGLHYTKTLVTRQKGDIKASWDEDEGLIMCFVIPTEQGAFTPEELAHEPEEQSFESLYGIERKKEEFGSDDPVIQLPTRKASTLLIVEDDPQIHSLLHEMLHHEYNLLHAYNGIEGLEMVREKMPEMVISDIRMPEMDGIALCKSIKSDPQWSHIIVLLLTSKTRIEERIEGYHCGADAYITKPFRADHLISVIYSQMHNRNRLKAYFNDQRPLSGGANEDEDNGQLVEALSEMDQRFMEKLHVFIDKSIEDPDININVIAVELGFSRTSFYRKMKSLTGSAPNDYVRNFRMKKAAKLIMEGNLSIAEISDQTGFGTQSHFSTAFKKYFGVSPKDYKEKWNEERKAARMKKQAGSNNHN